jgi:dCTP deaminase
LARRGSRLAQIRFRRGEAKLDVAQLAALQQRDRLVDADDAALNSGAIAVSVDLSGRHSAGLAGFRAKRHTGLIDVDKRDAYNVVDFWEPLEARGSKNLVLDPDAFYILSSKEAVHVPPDHAAEMVPFDPLVGEFRVHYAGFFDPGFGHAAAGGSGARAVLEVRSREVPFILEHSQTVGRLVYERLTEPAGTLYGAGLGSNYQAQSLKLSKHFKSFVR